MLLAAAPAAAAVKSAAGKLPIDCLLTSDAYWQDHSEEWEQYAQAAQGMLQRAALEAGAVTAEAALAGQPAHVRLTLLHALATLPEEVEESGKV
jgi:hypothetical protein